MKILMRRDCRYFLSCFALFWRDLDQMDFAFFVLAHCHLRENCRSYRLCADRKGELNGYEKPQGKPIFLDF